MYVESLLMPKYMISVMICYVSHSPLRDGSFVLLSCNKALAFDTVFGDGGGRHKTEST
jgi:hypothetical protein